MKKCEKKQTNALVIPMYKMKLKRRKLTGFYERTTRSHAYIDVVNNVSDSTNNLHRHLNLTSSFVNHTATDAH